MSVRSTVLLSRPVSHCRCDVCSDAFRHIIDTSIEEPKEPLMIPTFSRGYGWWNVRLPSKSMEPTIQLKGSELVYVDEEMMKLFEEKKVINWCRNLSKLYPVHTTGDGNCLMHAVILATCGIQDSGLVLRRLVYVALVESNVNSLRERWQRERERLNERIPGGLLLSPEEWDKEWNLVVSAAEDLRQTSPKYHQMMGYQFLEEMHVFVLANVLRRPIIILGESTVRSPLEGDAIEHNNFVGVYLPLLWRPLQCDINPIMLCFMMNHFQPLISRRSSPTDLLLNEYFAVPLVTSQLEPLHIHFLLPDEDRCAHDLLERYLNMTEISNSRPRGGGVGAATNEDVILAAEFIFSDDYYIWEDDDLKHLTTDAASRLKEVQKISGSPSTYNQNYIQPCQCKHYDKHTKESVKIQPDIRRSEQVTAEDKGTSATTNDSERTSVPNNIEIFNHLKRLTDNKKKEESRGNEKCISKDCTPAFNRLCSSCTERFIEDLELSERGDSLKKRSEMRNVKATAQDLRADAAAAVDSDDIKKILRRLRSEDDERLKTNETTSSDMIDFDRVMKSFEHKTTVYYRSFSLVAKRCSIPNCQRTVSKDTDPLCSEHCNSSRKNKSSYGGRSTTLDQDVAYSLKESKNKCRIYDCHRYGFDVYRGFCRSHFIVKSDDDDYTSGKIKHFEGERTRISPSSSYVVRLDDDFYLLVDKRGSDDDRSNCDFIDYSFYKIISMTDFRSESSFDVSNAVEINVNNDATREKSRSNVFNCSSSLIDRNEIPIPSLEEEKKAPSSSSSSSQMLETSLKDNLDFFNLEQKSFPNKNVLDDDNDVENCSDEIEKMPTKETNRSTDDDEMMMKDKSAAQENDDHHSGVGDADKNLKSSSSSCEEKESRAKKIEKRNEKDDDDDDDVMNEHIIATTLLPDDDTSSHHKLAEDDAIFPRWRMENETLAELETSPISLHSDTSNDSLRRLYSATDLVASGEESWNGSSTIVPPSDCHNVLCRNAVSDVSSEFCRSCLSVLVKERSAALDGVMVQTGESAQSCLTEGCCLPVTNQDFGLCRNCSEHQLQKSLEFMNKVALNPQQIKSFTKIVSSSEESSVAKLCVECNDLFGDPIYEGHCSKCWNSLHLSKLATDDGLVPRAALSS